MNPHEPSEVRVDVDGRTLKLSNLDKVLYPRTGTTKGEVLNYYAQVAPAMLPLLQDRCATRVRWPNGVEKQSFFEKNIPNGTPSWVRTAEVPTTGSRAQASGRARNGDVLVFPVVDDLSTLTWLANLAALELHVHQWTVTKAGKPQGANRLVIDLDPGDGAGLHECCRVALLVRDKLAERNLETEAVTSGSKGLHLYAALKRRKDPDASTALDLLAREQFDINARWVAIPTHRFRCQQREDKRQRARRAKPALLVLSSPSHQVGPEFALDRPSAS